MMVSVLLRFESLGILDGYPNLAAYVARGEARPAYKRAFDAQLAVYTGKPQTGRLRAVLIRVFSVYGS
jgi:glutathione S-transferase